MAGSVSTGHRAIMRHYHSDACNCSCTRAIMFLLEIIIATACARGNHRRCRFCRDYYRHRRIDVALYERMCRVCYC